MLEILVFAKFLIGNRWSTFVCCVLYVGFASAVLCVGLRAVRCSTGDLDFSLIMSRNPNLMLLHRARKKREVGK